MLALTRTAFLGAAFAGAAFLPAADDVGFGVDSASIVAKRFVEETGWELSMMDTTMDGEPMTQEMPLVLGSNARTVRVSDEYEGVEDGRITDLLREFVEIGASSRISLEEGGEAMEYETSSASPLEESLVRFRWNADEDRYDVEFEDGGDEALLRGLEIDMDLLALLPDGPVEKDDTWKLDGSAFAAVYRAGGDLRLELEEATPGSMFGIPTGAVIASSYACGAEILEAPDGELVARFVGTSEKDGRRLAEIRITGEVTGSRDLSELLQAGANGVLENTDTVDSWTLESSMELEVEAVLFWDLAAGRLAEFQSKAEFTGEHSLEWDETLFDAVTEFTAEYEIQGSSNVTIALDED